VSPGRAATFVVKPISAKARRRFARTGDLTLRVRVSAAGRVTGKALARMAGRLRRFDTASRSASRASTVRLHIHLSRAALNRLGETGRLKVVLKVAYSKVGRTARAELTLRRGANR